MRSGTWACAHVFNFSGGRETAEEGTTDRREQGVAGTDELEKAFAPVCASVGVELVDLELTGNALLVTVERSEGLDLDLVADVMRMISAFLDVHEELAPEGHYELEVSTPGLERRLRRPEHYRRALGTTVSIRTRPGSPGERRLEGILESVDGDGFVLVADGTSRHLRFDDVERAKTVFDWQEALRAASGSDRDELDDERAQKTTTKAREARG